MTEREAIEWLKGCVVAYEVDSKGKPNGNVTCELIQEVIDMAISALEKQDQDRWIPRKERLPEVHESGNSFSGIFMQSDPVLVYGVAGYEEETQFHVVTYCDDLDGHTYWSTELDALTVKGVKAWRPLPEPYTEEES